MTHPRYPDTVSAAAAIYQNFKAEVRLALPEPRTVGAFDPFYLSNTRRLINHGWGGIQIEPSPGPAARLRAAAPANVRVVEAACGDGFGRAHLWKTRWPGMPDGGAIASLRSECVSTGTWSDTTERSWVLGDSTGTQAFDLPAPYPVEVDVRTLDDILGDCPQIDLLVIDAETHEPEIFAGFTVEKYRPRLIVLEMCSDDMSGRMMAAGYGLLGHGKSDYYFALKD